MIEHSITDSFYSSLLRLLPPRLSEKCYYRWFCGKFPNKDKQQFQTPLRYANKPTRINALRGDVIGDAIFYTGAYEPTTSTRLMKIAAQDGGLFVDVGANIGYFSTLWCGARQDNRCIAIEASPRNVELLTRNILENGFSRTCEIKPVAASNEESILSFDQGPESQTGWGGISSSNESGDRLIQVRSERLDNLVPPNINVRLLKIDVEGAEALVLEGATDLLEQRIIQEIWFEDNEPRRERLGIIPERVFDALTRHGYQVESSNGNRQLPMDYRALCP